MSIIFTLLSTMLLISKLLSRIFRKRKDWKKMSNFVYEITWKNCRNYLAQNCAKLPISIFPEWGENLPNLKLASLIISGEGEAFTTKTLATDTKIITLNVELMFILIRVRLDFNCSGSNAEDRIYTGASISRTLRAFI